MISVVVRSKNEVMWLERCMRALSNQRLGNLDVILVDNESTDGTVEVAERFGARIVTISAAEFTYGRSLNVGIAMARHEAVAMLSAHCVPVNDLWADFMLANFASDTGGEVCGVYGRQLPLPDSLPVDARDLWTTFRGERVRQHVDYFFHNANSAIRHSIWKHSPFDEQIRGVEDREWGQRMVKAGYKLVYEPLASVYHQHGIHQGRDETRAKRVAQVIEYIRSKE
jgi:glycosyltransferase involved in cell wall biosynthesis